MRRRLDRRSQSGASLVESLVAIAVSMIMVVGILTVAVTGVTAGASATVIARMNVLATAFAETVKRLPFESCLVGAGDPYSHPASVYGATFATAESALPADVVRLQNALGATLTVEKVRALGDSTACTASTAGTQEVTVEVAMNDRTVRRTVVKRDPSLVELMDFWPIVTPDKNQTANTPLYAVDLAIGGSVDIESYEWWCVDTAWADPEASPPGDPNLDVGVPPADILGVGNTQPGTVRDGDSCVYPKPDVETPQAIVLRVVAKSVGGQPGRVGTKIARIDIPGAPVEPDAGVTLDLVSEPRCLSNDVAAGEAAPCEVDTELRFNPFFKGYLIQPPPDQRPAFRIDFGDGRILICQPALGSLSSACQTEDIVHSYSDGGVGRQVVMELLGTQNPMTGERYRSSLYLTVLGEELVRPVAVLRTNIQNDINIDTGQPGTGPNSAKYLIAPQTGVTFNAGASHAYNLPPGNGIGRYDWDFDGDGTVDNTTTTPTVTYAYPSYVGADVRRTYQATVRVLDAVSNLSSAASVTIVVHPLPYPATVVSPAVGRRSCGFLNLGVCSANIRFNLTGVPRLPGERIRYGIQLHGKVGIPPFYMCYGVTDNDSSESFSFDDTGLAGATVPAQLVGQLRACAGQTTTYQLRTERFSPDGQLLGATPWSDRIPLTLTYG